jgi:hypothetical protein
MNQKLLQQKTDRRKNALSLLEKQLENGFKPVKGMKPIMGRDLKTGELIRIDTIELSTWDKTRISKDIATLKIKIAEAEIVLRN